MSFVRWNNNGEPCTSRGVSTVWRGVCANLLRERRKGGALLLYFSESIQEGKLFSNKSRQTSLQEVQRPLMTPDECRRLPGLKKNAKGDVVDAGNMLIFPAGYSAIYGVQTLYFLDKEMDRRSKIPPPERSDNLIEVAF